MKYDEYRQAETGLPGAFSMRYLRPFLILLVLTLASAILLVAIFNKAKNDAKAHITTHEKMLAELVKNGIEEYFKFEVSQAEFLASDQDVVDVNRDGRNLLRQFYESQIRNLKNITRVDKTGHIAYSYPNAKVIGTYVGNQAHVQLVFKTQRPVLSSTFRAVQGYDAIALHVPVFKSGQFDGTVALVMPFEEIGKRYIGSIRIGTSGTAILFDETGAVLYSKGRKGSRQKVVESEYGFYMAQLRHGDADQFNSRAFTRPNLGTIEGLDDQAPIITYIAPVKNENITWFIKIALPENEALSYVSGFNRRWTYLFLAAIGLFGVWGVVLSRAFIVANREEEKRLANERVLSAEKETQIARALLMNAVDQSPAGIIIAEASTGQILLANDAVRRSGCIDVKGPPQPQSVADPKLWLISKPEGGTYEPGEIPIVRSLANGETVRNEIVAIGSDGAEQKWFSVNSSPVLGRQGDIVAAITVIQDMTEHKRSEEELRDMNMILEQRVARRTELMQESISELEAFSYAVSHDLRAPLRHLAGYSRILLDDYSNKLDQEGKEHLDSIIRSSEHMSVLIDSLLHLSRISRADMNRTQVDLSELAQMIVQELSSSVAEVDRQVAVEIEPSIVVQGDPSLLGIAMRNLISNAWKFSANCENASIKIGSKRDEDGYISIYVKDNGAGFNMDYVNKLFNAFQRLHSNSEYPGTGIGLTTVRRIIAKHGGRVWAEGKENEGATFWFTLPS